MPANPVAALTHGTRLGAYEVITAIGAGGPAVARVVTPRELWRGLAVAMEART